MVQKTLVMVKPDAFAAGNAGAIVHHFEKNGLKLKGLKALKLSKHDACKFYAVHKELGFYDELTSFMSSGPILAMVWEGDHAVIKVRDLLGNTDSKKAEPGTIRNLYGTDIGKNAAHGSDSIENAQIEVAFFFSQLELLD